jgi:hypothetical protein
LSKKQNNFVDFSESDRSVSLAIANNESKKLARLLVHLNLKS